MRTRRSSPKFVGSWTEFPWQSSWQPRASMPSGYEALPLTWKIASRLLTFGYRTAPPRHQSMHATVEWGYRLLSDLEQSILCRLSAFPASFTLGAAATAAADPGHSECEIIDHVLDLVAKSLIMADTQGAEPRLRLPETTRAYARAKLAESSEGDTFDIRQAA